MTLTELRGLACKQEVTVKELRNAIAVVKDTNSDTSRKRPYDYKKGDVYFQGALNHLVVLIKEIDGQWWGVLTTTSEHCSTRLDIETKERFSDKKAWYTKTILALDVKEMQFKGIADTYNLNKVLRIIRKSLIKI